MDAFYHTERRQKILFLPEDAVDTLQHMNPQQLLNIILPDDDWHVKTSNRNASGS